MASGLAKKPEAQNHQGCPGTRVLSLRNLPMTAACRHRGHHRIPRLLPECEPDGNQPEGHMSSAALPPAAAGPAPVFTAVSSKDSLLGRTNQEGDFFISFFVNVTPMVYNQDLKMEMQTVSLRLKTRGTTSFKVGPTDNLSVAGGSEASLPSEPRGSWGADPLP